MNRILKSLLPAALILALAASCTDSPSQQQVDTSSAIERGRADALALSEANFTSDRDLHSALLSVKSREWKMRSQGDSVNASAYIDAFRQYLNEIDTELANKVF